MSISLISKRSIDSYIIDERPKDHPDPVLDTDGKEYSYILAFQPLKKEQYDELTVIREDPSVHYTKGTKILVLKGIIDKSNERIYLLDKYLNTMKVKNKHKLVPEKCLWNTGILKSELLRRQDPVDGIYYDVFLLFPDRPKSKIAHAWDWLIEKLLMTG